MASHGHRRAVGLLMRPARVAGRGAGSLTGGAGSRTFIRPPCISFAPLGCSSPPMYDLSPVTPNLAPSCVGPVGLLVHGSIPTTEGHTMSKSEHCDHCCHPDHPAVATVSHWTDGAETTFRCCGRCLPAMSENATVTMDATPIPVNDSAWLTHEMISKTIRLRNPAAAAAALRCYAAECDSVGATGLASDLRGYANERAVPTLPIGEVSSAVGVHTMLPMNDQQRRLSASLARRPGLTVHSRQFAMYVPAGETYRMHGPSATPTPPVTLTITLTVTGPTLAVADKAANDLLAHVDRLADVFLLDDVQLGATDNRSVTR